MSVTCELCFHHCHLEEGQTGFCRARICRNGAVVLLNYGKLTSLALDPIEKKPLRRFHPGSLILSVGSFGCNLRCPFCQNHEISMAGEAEIQTVKVSPAQLAAKASELRAHGNIGVAYTYNEPLVSYEYVRDCAELVHEQGMVNVLVTNGTIEEGPWRALLPLIDAANIDLKGFTPAWYRRLGGDSETVKRSIALAAERCHVEVTTLLIPGENDSAEEIRALAQWLASVSQSIPLHLSRFFPQYKMTDRPPTPVEQVYRLAEAAREYLSYVYTGNC
ncbi:MAG: AmmeMemoRadiSam system radical SAM enzyme [Oscillospiraceae bacterium]|jgi:pyruvate formate lyase activating enzyme|nr:AmmeMemoRadiSam system radical SAM enzyme [Oscillospiraceae bacterium]